MNCPSCGAGVMLGSAQCGKCGSSLLGGGSPPSLLRSPEAGPSSLGDLSSARPGGPPDPPHIHPVEPGSGLGPPPPPPVTARAGRGTGYSAPPPPAPGWQLGNAGPKPGRTIQVGPTPTKRSGCGCLTSLFVLALVGGIGAAVYNWVSEFDGFTDFLESFETGFDGLDAGELPVGTVVEGELEAGDADDYSFTGNGQALTLVVLGSDDTVLEVTETDGGDEVATNDDSGPGSRNPILRFTFEEGVDYTVRVRAFNDDDPIDSYELVAAPMGEAAQGPDGAVLDAGTIERGGTRHGVILRGEEARYQLFGGGGPHTIDVRAVGDSDPRIVVESVDGATLASDDDSGDEPRSARVTVDLPEGQVATLVIDGFADGPAAYVLEVT